MIVQRKPRIGLLLIGSPRFKELGEGTAHGTYGARKQGEQREILHSFQEIGEIVTPGIVYEREDVANAIDLFFTKKVDCVAAAYLSWAEDFAWIRFLRDMPPVPLFFTSIFRDRVDISDTNDEDEFVEFLSAGSLVGVQEASGDLRRFHRPMTRAFIGTMDQVKKELGVFAQAALCRAQLRDSTIGLLASYNEAMWSTYVDPYNVFMKAGPELRFLSVAQLTEKIGSVPKGAVEEAVRGIEERFRISANVDREKLAASVRASIALEELSGDYGIDLTVLNDIDPVLLGSVGLRPGFCPTRGDSRLTVVPEGDIGGGLAVYILKLLTSGTDSRQAMPGRMIIPNVPETWWWPGMSGSRKPNTVMRGLPLHGMFFPRGRKPCCICRKKTAFLKWYARWWRLRLPSITWRAIPIPSSATKPCPRRNCFSGLSRSV